MFWWGLANLSVKTLSQQRTAFITSDKIKCGNCPDILSRQKVFSKLIDDVKGKHQADTSSRYVRRWRTRSGVYQEGSVTIFEEICTPFCVTKWFF